MAAALGGVVGAAGMVFGGGAEIPSGATERADLEPAGFRYVVAVQPEGGAPEGPPSNSDLPFLAGWKREIELGLNGSTGNTETFNFRAGFDATRKAQETQTLLALLYVYAIDDGEKTKSRGELSLRNDWALGESRWSIFALGRVEYDEFQDWRWRISAYLGPAYAFIKARRTQLTGRAGVGAAREFGGERNEVIPEGLLGLDFTHQLTRRQKIFYTGEYLPSLSNFSEYRLSQKAGWEVLVDPEVKMTLKLGVEHRFQSNPGDGFNRNDLDYFALLLWAF